MEWYEILATVIGCIIGSYLLFILVLVLECPQRQYMPRHLSDPNTY
jgi:hypothetical protein